MPIIRPNGIECPKWEPVSPGAKACRYYLKPGDSETTEKQILSDAPTHAGMCKLPDEMLCVEWVRKNGTPEQKAQLVQLRRGPQSPAQAPARASYDDPPPLVLSTQERPAPRAPATIQTPSGRVQMAPPKPFEPAKEIPEDSLEALERAGVEVELQAPHIEGGIVLVPKRTGRTDRNEMTFREAATIRLIVDAFPGAHVVAYKPGVHAPDEPIALVDDDPLS